MTRLPVGRRREPTTSVEPTGGSVGVVHNEQRPATRTPEGLARRAEGEMRLRSTEVADAGQLQR